MTVQTANSSVVVEVYVWRSMQVCEGLSRICCGCWWGHGGPPLHLIPVSRLLQIVSIDVMELPRTERGNNLVLVFQDLFSK